VSKDSEEIECKHGPGDTVTIVLVKCLDEVWYKKASALLHIWFDAHLAINAHIMSKCPDAQACLQKLVLPAMEKISDKVDFKLSSESLDTLLR
jgi:hypothetical protein